MIFSAQLLRQILPEAKFVGIRGDEQFDLLNIAHLKQFESLSSKRALYFVVYKDNPDLLGWYDRAFDRSANIQRVKSDDQITFVVDSRVGGEQLIGIRYIRVRNIFDAINRIREYIINQINPKVVGVTGSVGKTTGTALIHSVLKKKFPCGRIYSKRLTPLTLSSWLVNFLEPTHEMLALEYSMYRKNHIGMLTDLLRPDVGVFLNVKRMHLGVEDIHSLDDIVEGKRALVDKSGIAILNLDDPFVAKLQRRGDLGFSLLDTRADAYISTNEDVTFLHLNQTAQKIAFTPYLKTNLFYQQVCAAGLIGEHFGIPGELIASAFEEFKPAEQRINWLNIHEEKVLFDGDVTHGARMMALAEHHYLSSILLVHSFDFGSQVVETQIDDMTEVFSRFTEIRILDTEENRVMILEYGWKNLQFVSKEDFLTNIRDFEFKVLHFGIYFRKHVDLIYLIQFLNT